MTLSVIGKDSSGTHTIPEGPEGLQAHFRAEYRRYRCSAVATGESAETRRVAGYGSMRQSLREFAQVVVVAIEGTS